MSATRRAGLSRRGLQITVGTLATVAVGSGLTGMLAGPDVLPGTAPVDATVDSGFRFVSAFWFAAGLLLWWAVPQVERVTVWLRAVLAVVFLGGVARLLAVADSGWPHPVLRVALVVELFVVPAVAWWQGRVRATANR